MTSPKYIHRIFLLIAIMAFGSLPIFAQVYQSTGYYYNNFDGGTVGNGFAQIGANAALQVSNSSALAAIIL